MKPPPPYKDTAFALKSPEECQTTYARLKDSLPTGECVLRSRLALPSGSEHALYSEEEAALIGGLLSAERENGQVHAFHLWIAPPFRGRGLATRFGQSYLRWAFSHRIHRLEVAHQSDHEPAERLSKRLGFLPEGIQRAAYEVDSCWINLAHYGLLRMDYQP